MTPDPFVENLTISHNINVPRGDNSTGIPEVWVNDSAMPSFSALGLATFLLSYPPGFIIGKDEFEDSLPSDDPLSEIVADLVSAGYLVRDEDAPGMHYRLVHPDRLPPLPAF